jgi:hypothetical protein
MQQQRYRQGWEQDRLAAGILKQDYATDRQ